MSMRISSALVLLALAGCAAEGEPPPPSDVVECALGGAAGFAPDCTMERVTSDGQDVLVIRHPDGGFRRFELGVEGRGIVTADGVEQASVERQDGTVEVRVGADRYRLPFRE